MKTFLSLFISCFLACNSFSQAAGSISLQNMGPCNLTNITTVSKVVAMRDITGVLTIGDSVPGDYPIVPGSGGQTGLTNGQIVVIGAAGLSTNKWADIMIWIKSGNAAGFTYLGMRRVSGMPGGGAIIGVFPDCYTNPPPCITNSLAAPVQNGRGEMGIAVWYMDGVLEHSQMIGPGATLTYTYEWCRTVNEAGPVLRWGVSYSESAILPDGEGGFAVGSIGSDQNQNADLGTVGAGLGNISGGGAGTAPNILNNTNAPITGGLTNNTARNLTNGFPIVWDGTDTTAARDATLRAGFNKLASQNNSIIGGLLMVNQSINSQTNGGGGGIGEFPSDFPDSGTHSRLDSIYNVLTNNDGTMFGTITNIIGADYSEVNAPLEEALEGITGGTMDTTVPSGTGDSFWTVELLPGVPFNFRPSYRFAEVYAVAYKIFSWLLLLAYLTKIMQDVFLLLKVAAFAQQTKVKDVQATFLGIGGNWGVFLAPVVVAAFLIAYAIFLAAALSGVSTVLTGQNVLDFFSGPFAGVPSVVYEGIAESALFFPWAFFIGLAGAYMVWLATKNVLSGIFLIAVRMIIS